MNNEKTGRKEIKKSFISRNDKIVEESFDLGGPLKK